MQQNACATRMDRQFAQMLGYFVARTGPMQNPAMVLLAIILLVSVGFTVARAIQAVGLVRARCPGQVGWL